MKSNQIRIIGGKWKSRKISFPSTEILRPTPDRVRETVFNWLSPYIQDSHCLDLFAGSGAFSFEALSRGAKSVIALEKENAIFKSLEHNAKILKVSTEELELFNEDCLKCLEKHIYGPPFKTAFDIVFLDPPYKLNLIFPSLNLLTKGAFLKPNALVYCETDFSLDFSTLSISFKLLKEKKAGNVCYYLLQYV